MDGRPAVTDPCACAAAIPFVFQASPAALAKCVLAEVPKQVVEYYSHMGYGPKTPVLDSPTSVPNTPE